jgi:hypothetical protein
MTAARRAARLSPKRIALLHVARRELGLSDPHYRAILAGAAGVRSSTELCELGFEAVMHQLTALGFRSTWTARTYGQRPGMATPAQVDLMRGLWREYHGADPRDAQLNRWLAKYHKIGALRFVDAEKAGAVLAALRVMAKRPRT